MICEGIEQELECELAEAARRPRPVPKPPVWPGQQMWSGGDCVAPSVGMGFWPKGGYCVMHVELYGFPPATEYWVTIAFQNPPDLDISPVKTNANGRTSTGGISLWPSSSTAARAQLSHMKDEAINMQYFFKLDWSPLIC